MQRSKQRADLKLHNAGRSVIRFAHYAGQVPACVESDDNLDGQ
jgi:hypothetical protein